MTGEQRVNRETYTGVWSAAPTPFTSDMAVDVAAVGRMVDHHLRLGIDGLFLCGTCGEGPWMTDAQRRAVVRLTVEAVQGRLPIAVQVTDNSSARIIDNMRWAADEGADIAIVAPPNFLLNATPENVTALFMDAIDASPLPVGIYARSGGAVPIELSVYAACYAHDKVCMVKDSTQDLAHRDTALAAREKRPELALLNGNEFDCVSYIAAGYDGLLLGGGVFNGYLARQILEAVQAGDLELGRQIQTRMTRLMFDVFGGEKITCWLTGQKQLLVDMGIFSTTQSYLRYPMTDACREAIRAAFEREKHDLLP